MKKYLSALAVLALLFVGGACTPEESNSGSEKNEGEKTVQVTGISLDRSNVTIKEGESVTLVATVKPDNAENKNVSWSSSDAGVASVNNSGIVTGLKAGSATVTATTEDGGKTSSCVVLVEPNTALSVTVGVDKISAISAVLKGKANLGNTSSSDLTVGFQYSKSAGILPSNSITVEVKEADANYNYTTAITGLEPGTVYYFRSFVRQNGQDTYGETMSFTTKDIVSLLETKNASDIEATSATLNAKLDLTDISYRSITYGFYWGTSESNQDKFLSGGDIADNAYAATMGGLSSGKMYWYKAYVKLDSQVFHGEVRSFTTVVLGVDLGLPSGLKWATCNIGASSPEEYGDYYAWGETSPKSNYNWSTYEWCNGSSISLTKYNTSNSYGAVDNKTVLDPEDDAAHVNLGGKWRMPTEDEWTELRENCTWKWTTRDGVEGYRVTATNGKSIFLPAAGYRNATILNGTGSYGYYWSSSLESGDPYYARNVGFSSGNVYRSSFGMRYYGLSVRPVYGEFISVESVSLNKTSLSLTVGDTQTLTATVTPSNATYKSVTWSSSNTSVASVSSSGVVTAKSAGTATITVTTNDGGKKATCSVTVILYTVTTPEAIDLGLPSGLKWASFNLGSSSPEEYGDYFAWGETEPYYSRQNPLTWRDGKTGYYWASYKWCKGSRTTMTKYCSNSSYGYNGFTDNKTVLDPEDDAAHVYLGSKWRMPTDADWTELRTKCTWTWTTRNGKNGHLVTGSNGNNIFLPAAGHRDGAILPNAGSSGYYWSSSLDTDFPDGAWLVGFSSGNVYRIDDEYRYSGLSVRPVTE